MVKTERTKGTAINIPGRRIRNVEKKYMYENNLCLTQYDTGNFEYIWIGRTQDNCSHTAVSIMKDKLR